MDNSQKDAHNLIFSIRWAWPYSDKYDCLVTMSFDEQKKLFSILTSLSDQLDITDLVIEEARNASPSIPLSALFDEWDAFSVHDHNGDDISLTQYIRSHPTYLDSAIAGS